MQLKKNRKCKRKKIRKKNQQIAEKIAHPSYLFLQSLCLWYLPSKLFFNTSKDHPGLFAHGPEENSGRIGLTNGLVILTS